MATAGGGEEWREGWEQWYEGQREGWRWVRRDWGLVNLIVDIHMASANPTCDGTNVIKVIAGDATRDERPVALSQHGEKHRNIIARCFFASKTRHMIVSCLLGVLSRPEFVPRERSFDPGTCNTVGVGVHGMAWQGRHGTWL